LLVATTILVDYLRGLEEVAAVLEQRQGSLLLSSVVVAELYAGVRDAEREQLATALSAFRVCPVTEEITRRGGLLPIRE
jgi:predicted nucleic acid-binding protein